MAGKEMDASTNSKLKILVLAKRQYSGKDLLDDRFGRLRELPLELAKLGHRVAGICFSYRQRQQGVFADYYDGRSCVVWHSVNLGRFAVSGLVKYVVQASRLTREMRPDLIWACSDSFHAIFGARLARICRTKCVVDLYDNFESFKATQLPGVRPIFKRAVRAADGVTCVSRRLADLVVGSYRRDGPLTVLQNAVRPDLFYHRDRTACRQRLGLPADARIIGTAGALYANRGIDALFQGFEILAAKDDNLHLAIAGPRQRRIHIPNRPRVHDLGILPLEEVPALFSALDVAVVCNRNSAFGCYSFPQKAYEIIACRVPLVAAAVGSMNEMLAEYPQCLYEPENPKSLAQAIERQLEARTVVNLPAPSWADSARQLADFFEKVVHENPLPLKN